MRTILCIQGTAHGGSWRACAIFTNLYRYFFYIMSLVGDSLIWLNATSSERTPPPQHLV